MKLEWELLIRRLVRGLNGDIQREFQLADAYLRQARFLPVEQYPVICRQIAGCAAAALANATALAAEVLALGGIPAIPAEENPHEIPPRTLPRRYRLGPRAMLTHYRRRLRMAEGLGMLRLCEVFQQIVRTKELHLAHTGFVAGCLAGRHLWS